METRANYTIVGFFTVLVIAAAFGFVFWMSNFGQTGDTATLLVRIPGSANGLSVGSAVRFNGIQVGTVRALTIDKKNPNYVVARSEVRTDAPVYETTKAVLEIQGLTGSAYIELSGGEVEGQNLIQQAFLTGKPATLQADQSSVTNILATADQILQKVNSVVSQFGAFANDARGPLTKTLENTQVFSKALADNSQGIDKFLESVAALSDTVTNLSTRLDSTLSSAQELVDAVDPKDVSQIVANVNTTTEQIAAASQDINTTLSSFRQTAETYADVGRKAQTTLDDVDRLLASVDSDKIGTTVDNVTAATVTARQSLADVAEITARFKNHAEDVDKTINNFSEMATKLNAASSRVDGLLAKVDGFLGEGGSGTSSIMADAQETLKSFRSVADNLNARIGPIANNLQAFSGSGLKDVQNLINELRRAVSSIQGSVTSIEQNPQRLIFGGDQVKQYDGRTRR